MEAVTAAPGGDAIAECGEVVSGDGGLVGVVVGPTGAAAAAADAEDESAAIFESEGALEGCSSSTVTRAVVGASSRHKPSSRRCK